MTRARPRVRRSPARPAGGRQPRGTWVRSPPIRAERTDRTDRTERVEKFEKFEKFEQIQHKERTRA